jgi:predicted transcriptional regulator
MNYLQEKKEILELKLKLTAILIDKKLCIRNQQYEKVADLRDEEKELLQLLDSKNKELIETQKKFESEFHTVEDQFQFLSLLNEISIY